MDAWSLTNKKLSERILETERAKKQSMENLETTNQDLTNMDYNIKLLKKAVEEKNPSKMVAESRLEVTSKEEEKAFSHCRQDQLDNSRSFLHIDISTNQSPPIHSDYNHYIYQHHHGHQNHHDDQH